MDAVTLAIAKKAAQLPIATYVHSGNKEVVVTAVDATTDTFTSVAHGLADGDRIIICLNTDNTVFGYALTYLPTGITYGQYYVVNKTDDTFKLSASSGGAAINLTAKATMDLTKWHIELPKTDSVTISSLPPSKKYRVVGKGLIPRAQFYLRPNGVDITNVYMETGNTSIARYPLIISATGELGIYLDVLIDFTDFLVLNCKGYAIAATDDAKNTVTLVNKTFISTVDKGEDITSIALYGSYLPNGFVVEVYKA